MEDPVSTLPYIAVPDHTGPHYQVVLRALHQHLRPKSYLEIGTQNGVTLAMSECASIAVDPQFRLTADVVGKKPQCWLFQQTSDAFFGSFNPAALFGKTVDLAFLDGMHYYEYLLRDFINIEKHCAPNSVVLLHDCIPCDTYVGRRELADRRLGDLARNPEWWAGDVWKTALGLKKYRPDLRIHAFDAPPTGLIAVTNLDAKSTLIADNYFAIAAEYAELDLAGYGIDNLHQALEIRSATLLTEMSPLSKLFWL